MDVSFGIWQLVFIGLLFLGACVSVFLASRRQNTQLIYIAIGLLGLTLMVAFPDVWLILCLLVLTAGGCIVYYGQTAKSFQKSILGIILLLAGAIAFVVVRQFTGPDDEDLLKQRRMLYDLAQYEKLGKVANEKHPAAKAAVIVPADMTEQQKELVKAFEKGIGAPVVIVEEKTIDFQQFQQDNAGLSDEAYEQKLAEEKNKYSVEALLKSPKMAGVKVVLMMTALPGKKDECVSLLNTVKAKRMSLLVPADSAKRASVWLEPYIRGGQVCALVLVNADSAINRDVPENEDMTAAFNARYVLVTSENIDAMKNDPKYGTMLVDHSPEN